MIDAEEDQSLVYPVNSAGCASWPLDRVGDVRPSESQVLKSIEDAPELIGVLTRRQQALPGGLLE